MFHGHTSQLTRQMLASDYACLAEKWVETPTFVSARDRGERVHLVSPTRHAGYGELKSLPNEQPRCTQPP